MAKAKKRKAAPVVPKNWKMGSVAHVLSQIFGTVQCAKSPSGRHCADWKRGYKDGDREACCFHCGLRIARAHAKDNAWRNAERSPQETGR